MKNLVKKCFPLIFFSLLLVGCQSQTSSLETEAFIEEDINGLVGHEIDHYEIDVDLDNQAKTFTGKQKTTFTNSTDQDLSEIYFRLYPNAFKDFEDAPNLSQDNHYSEESYVAGFIDIENVEVNHKDSDFLIEGDDKTLLKIVLDESLLANESLEIEMDYFVKLPSSMGRFGYTEDKINFGNWYPVLSIYDEDGWSKDPYYALGDPFYTDIANYDVNITVDEEIVLATSGNILNEEVENGKKQYQIEGKMIRDFAFVTSPDFKLVEGMVGETAVRLYYSKGSRKVTKEAMQYAVDSLDTFNKEFGSYPYGNYSVVITDFVSGMEYPGLVYISENYFNRPSLGPLEQIIVHETAHQWWYALVGNNEVKEPWLDEGLASYSEVIYIDQLYGSKQAARYYQLFFEEEYAQIDEYLPNNHLTVNKALDEFDDEIEYSLLAYVKPTVFLETIKEEYGKETVTKILSTYFEKYKYKNATTADFLSICEAVTGDDFEAMKEKWLK